MIEPYYQQDGCTIFCGDAKEIVPQLRDVQVVLTDPPWEMSSNQIEIRGAGIAPQRQKSKTLRRGVVGEFDADVIRLCQDVAENDCLFLCGYKELADLVKTCDPLRGIFAWHKPNGAPAVFYPAKMDLSFIVWTGRKSLLYGHQHWPSMVFSVPFPAAGCMATERFCDDTGKAVHPCQGPLLLYEKLLAPFPRECRILDCYLGTGTTLVAAMKFGHRAIGIERDRNYCRIAANRLRQRVLQFEGHDE